MPGIRQTSFGAGEFDPRLWGRTDLKPYGVGARKLRNFFPSPHGSILSRPGTVYINRTKDDGVVRLIPFNYADIADQNYVLEFGLEYIRFHTSLGTVADPITPTIPYEIVTPYQTEDLARLKYVQVGDTVTIVHPKYAARELKRIGHTDWTLTEIDFSAAKPKPITNLQIDTSVDFYPTIDATHPGKKWEWGFTWVFSDGRESELSLVSGAVHTVDKTSGLIACFSDRPVHLLLASYFSTPPAKTAVRARIYKGRNDVWGYIGSVDLSNNSVQTYTGGATTAGIWFVDEGIEPDYTIGPPRSHIKFSLSGWEALRRYEIGDRVVNDNNVYECVVAGLSAVSGGPTGTGSLIVDGAPDWVPNTNYTAWAGPVVGDFVSNRGRTFRCKQTGTSAVSPATGPYKELEFPATQADGTVLWYFWGHGEAVRWRYVAAHAGFPNPYPATVAIFEQRRIFGGSQERPGVLWGSRVDQYETFVADNSLFTVKDPIEFELASRRREQIRSMVGLRHLMTFTNSSEWSVSGAANGDPMSPISIRARVQSEHGSSWLDPLVVGNTLIHVQPKGTVVRDIYFDVNIDSYTGNELSLLSQHFFRGHEIVSWAWAEDPYSVVWAVRDDGALLSMTYVREQELNAWAIHSSTGLFEQVCSIPEGKEDSVYFVVNRDGARCIERMTTREISAVEDAHCVDCGVFYDGVSTNTVTVPDVLNDRTDLVALVDGNVVSSVAASAGSVTLPFAGTKIHVGISYECTFEALDVAQDRERQKAVREVLVDVEASRGFWVGESTDDMGSWVEYTPRTLGGGFGALPLSSQTARVSVSSKWGLAGRVGVQQRYPLPLSITALQRELASGGY